MRAKNIQFCLLIFIIFLFGCKKLISIGPPANTITSSQVFSTNGQATSAISGVYYNMTNGYLNFSNSGITILCGMSADEFIPFDETNLDIAQFQQNSLVSTNGNINILWQRMYSTLYGANAIIAGLKVSSSINDSVKKELTGEAEFIRAFCNFYLVNLFGDEPLVSTINWQKTNLLLRTPVQQVYEAIIADLVDAKTKLALDYSVGLGQRIVPNKWAAASLLARVYLYLGDWTNAISQTDSVISNSGLYSLNNDLNTVFLINNAEAIWQLQQNNKGYPFNGTQEGSILIPYDSTTPPFCYITNVLLNSFDSLDKRKSSWIDSTVYNGVKYYFPYKYKVGPADVAPNGSVTEYYMVIRLAEQYLIRAEAEAQLNNIQDAKSDLDVIRNRAGLPNSTASTKTEILTAIYHENQVEFFGEWGHRWLDLKRTLQAINTLPTAKGIPVSNNDLLYPIPLSELQTDPNLTQNVGY